MRFFVCISLFCFGAAKLPGQDNLRLIEASFNTSYDEYCAQDFGIGFTFCSNRRIEFYRQSIDAEYKPNTNLLYIEGKINATSEFSGVLNSVENEGPFCFSADQKRIYFTGSIVSKRANTTNWLGLFYSDFVDGVWGEKQALPINSDDGSFNVAHPCLSPDGKFLVFSSNMQGGLGGNDLYAFEINAKGFSIPYNLGPMVNSSSDELTPFIATNNILYFSADDTEEGDFDIYSAPFDSEVLGAKSRLLEPLNSEFDDVGFWLNSTNSEGTISSCRNSHDFDVFLISGYNRALHSEKADSTQR